MPRQEKELYTTNTQSSQQEQSKETYNTKEKCSFLSIFSAFFFNIKTVKGLERNF